MNNETPGKVLGLLGLALTSMFFLFAVSVTNAGFSGADTTFPDPFSPKMVAFVVSGDPFGTDKVVAFLNKDPFGPDHVLAMLDNASQGYSNFLAANLFQPAQFELAFVKDNVSWIADNSVDPIVAMAGLKDVSSVGYYQNLDRAQQAPKVAGAYTGQPYRQGFSVNSLYSFLIR